MVSAGYCYRLQRQDIGVKGMGGEGSEGEVQEDENTLIINLFYVAQQFTMWCSRANNINNDIHISIETH